MFFHCDRYLKIKDSFNTVSYIYSSEKTRPMQKNLDVGKKKKEVVSIDGRINFSRSTCLPSNVNR